MPLPFVWQCRRSDSITGDDKSDMNDVTIKEAGDMGNVFLLIMASMMSSTLVESRPPAEALRLTVFDCGSLRLEDVASFGLANADTPVRDLFVPCYLIEHP